MIEKGTIPYSIRSPKMKMKIKEGYWRVSIEIDTLPSDAKKKFIEEEMEYRGWDELIYCTQNNLFEIYIWRVYL